MIGTNAALLVIDAQESFRHRPYWDETDLPGFLRNMQALVDGATARGIPVVQIFHVEDEGAFSLAGGHVRTMSPLTIRPAAVFHKRRHSALVGSGLDVWLVTQASRGSSSPGSAPSSAARPPPGTPPIAATR